MAAVVDECRSQLGTAKLGQRRPKCPKNGMIEVIRAPYVCSRNVDNFSIHIAVDWLHSALCKSTRISGKPARKEYGAFEWVTGSFS